MLLVLPSQGGRHAHTSSADAERATENLVTRAWPKCGPEKLFRMFTDDQTIPVKEPNSIHEVYVGVVLAPGEAMEQRARSDKKLELRIAKYALGASAILTVIGVVLFLLSKQESVVRWLSGATDRLATTALATMALSWLNFRVHLAELQRQPVVDWR